MPLPTITSFIFFMQHHFSRCGLVDLVHCNRGAKQSGALWCLVHRLGTNALDRLGAVLGSPQSGRSGAAT
jgi:hypothetical protein